MLPLLRTKTTIPPARPKRVDRPRLGERVQEGMQRALTLVVAPAGFGKTTLAAEWARGARMPVAWLSLEPAERAPERFLAYLIYAFQSVDPHLGQTALALLHSGQVVADETCLHALLNDLSEFPSALALVLDDYHSADCPAVAPLVQCLLTHRPPGLHLVLASRAAPALNLARLRALDQVVEITVADLRFTAAEIRLFLERVMGAHLNAEQLAQLTQSTEGWAVGLQLVGLALARQPAEWRLPAGQAHVFDYLASEVLHRESPAVQAFLKKTALFDRFCVPLCEHLLDQTEALAAAELLAYVERANLFLVPLDAAGTWFRYHSLFTDFLRKHLTPAQALPLYYAASQWFEQNGLIDDAIHYATHAGDFERAAGLLEATYRDLLLRGEQAALLEWLNSLPAEMVAARPRLALAKGWAGAILIDMEIAEAAARQAEGCIPSGATGAQLRGELKSLRILVGAFQGRLPAPEELSEAYILFSEQDDFLHSLLHFNLGLTNALAANTVSALAAFDEAMRLAEKLGLHLVFIFAGTQLGEQQQLHGELALAERTFQQIIRYAQKNLGEHTFLLGMPYVSYAELLRETNRFEEARQYAEQGIVYCQQWQPMASIDGLLTLARLETGRGDWPAGRPYFDQALRTAETTKSFLDDSFVAMQRIRTCLQRGDLAQAEHWLTAYRIEATAPRMYRHFQDLIAPAFLRADLLRGECPPAQVAARIAALIPDLERRERIALLIEALLLHAYASQAAGRAAAAAASLARALTLAARGGYLRLLADEGQRLLLLLEQYRPDLNAPQPYFDNLLDLLRREAARPASPAETIAAAGVTPLTRRELDILALLAAGQSNQEIAAARTLTLNTVKKHVANILSKLGVANRTQAVVRAKQLGWLE